MKNTVTFLQRLSLADMLPLGYLYLLLLGIASDSIYYGLLGINFISYSNVLDVLLSPLVHLTDSLSFPAIIIGIPLVLYGLIKWDHKRKAKAEKPSPAPSMLVWLLLSAWVIFSAFIGFGLGGGFKMQERLRAGEIKPNHAITFTSGQAVEVKLIGHNSGYLFYVEPGDSTVTIAPVQGNVVRIEQLEW